MQFKIHDSAMQIHSYSMSSKNRWFLSPEKSYRHPGPWAFTGPAKTYKFACSPSLVLLTQWWDHNMDRSSRHTAPHTCQRVRVDTQREFHRTSQPSQATTTTDLWESWRDGNNASRMNPTKPLINSAYPLACSRLPMLPSTQSFASSSSLSACAWRRRSRSRRGRLCRKAFR